MGFPSQADFDLYRVNALRERLQRGRYAVAGADVAEQLVIDHLTTLLAVEAIEVAQAASGANDGAIEAVARRLSVTDRSACDDA